jgi:hypothetical protein
MPPQRGLRSDLLSPCHSHHHPGHQLSVTSMASHTPPTHPWRVGNQTMLPLPQNIQWFSMALWIKPFALSMAWEAWLPPGLYSSPASISTNNWFQPWLCYVLRFTSSSHLKTSHVLLSYPVLSFHSMQRFCPPWGDPSLILLSHRPILPPTAFLWLGYFLSLHTRPWLPGSCLPTTEKSPTA